MHIDISEFLIYLAVGIAGWMIRHIRSISKWRKVRKIALEDISGSPQTTMTRQEAVTKAINEIQGDRIRRVSSMLPIYRNGTGPHKKV